MPEASETLAAAKAKGWTISDIFITHAHHDHTQGVAEVKQAMADAWGVDPVETGIGGSIPFISDLVELFPAAQFLVTGV